MKTQEHLWTRKSSKTARYKLANTTEACNPVGRPLCTCHMSASNSTYCTASRNSMSLTIMAPKLGFENSETKHDKIVGPTTSQQELFILRLLRGLGSDTAVAHVVHDSAAGPRYHRMMHDVQPGAGIVATLSTASGTFGTCGTVADMHKCERNLTRIGAGTLPKLQASSSRETASPSLNCTALSSPGNCSWRRHVKVQISMDHPHAARIPINQEQKWQL